MSRKRLWISSLVPAALLAVVAAGVVAHAASPGATIKIAPGASLANPPSQVVVTVDYSCLPSAYTYGSVNVDQSQSTPSVSGGRTDVFAFGYFQPVCDGKPHHAVVVASTYYGYGNFVPGIAGASASVSSGAVYASAQVQLKIS